MDGLSVQSAAMVKHITDVEGHTKLLKGQLQECEMHWNRASASNACLQRQSSVLTAQLPVRSNLSTCFAGQMSVPTLGL